MKRLLALVGAFIILTATAHALPLMVAFPAQAPLGKPLMLTIQALPGDTLRVSWDGRTYTPGDRGDGLFSLILGTTLNRHLVGTRQELQIILRRDAVNYLIKRTVLITAANYPQEHLSVEPKYVAPPRAQLASIERQRQEVKTVLANTLPQKSFTWPWIQPVADRGVTSVFGKQRIYNGTPKSFHSGLDLRASTGTPVLAVADGVVALTQHAWFSGNTVYIDHGAGLVTTYMHLSRIDVTAGQKVNAGSRIGLAGATGRVTGPHLHLGVAIGGKWMDPAPLLNPKNLPIQTKKYYDLSQKGTVIAR